MNWRQANRAFYESRAWTTVGFDRRILKYPTDLYVYEEVIRATQPEVIVETGSFEGGSAEWFSRFAEVVSVDTKQPVDPAEGVTFLQGDSIDLAYRVAEIVDGRRALVSLDSDHHAEHVLDELKVYAPLASDYLVVEDTAIDVYGIDAEAYPEGGPGLAVAWWLEQNPGWSPDPACDRFLIGMNPGGWLKRASS